MIDQYILGDDNVVEIDTEFTRDMSIEVGEAQNEELDDMTSGDDEKEFINNFFTTGTSSNLECAPNSPSYTTSSSIRSSGSSLKIKIESEKESIKIEDIENCEELKFEIENLELVQSQDFNQELNLQEQQEEKTEDLQSTTEPAYHGLINVTIKTQIQTNRRTNIYLDANWPEEVVNKKMPIYYYPPLDESIHEKYRNTEDPSKLWLTKLTKSSNGNENYLEVQYWLKTQDGKMQLISKCGNHASLIKMSGSQYEEKAVSHEEVKWTRSTMIFGVNFNCTRTCFKSELYVFIRARAGSQYFESGFTELPFRRSEKRKHEHNCDGIKQSKKQIKVEETNRKIVKTKKCSYQKTIDSTKNTANTTATPSHTKPSFSTSVSLEPLVATSSLADSISISPRSRSNSNSSTSSIDMDSNIEIDIDNIEVINFKDMINVNNVVIPEISLSSDSECYSQNQTPEHSPSHSPSYFGNESDSVDLFSSMNLNEFINMELWCPD